MITQYTNSNRGNISKKRTIFHRRPAHNGASALLARILYNNIPHTRRPASAPFLTDAICGFGVGERGILVYPSEQATLFLPHLKTLYSSNW